MSKRKQLSGLYFKHYNLKYYCFYKNSIYQYDYNN